MRNRIVEIGESPARLRVDRRQLVIESNGHPHQVPLDELAVLVVAHPQVSYTQAVLSELVAAGGTFVTCDQSRMPIGLLLPLDANSIQTERFRQQLSLSKPRAKQLWKEVVCSKIGMQAWLLEQRIQSDAGLRGLIPLVRSGDPTNIEARAARRYWTALFGSDFRRDRNAEDHNRMLNYGYAVLRAAVARALAAHGLHPSLGIHHHNRYNAFCLADDLMEPYRPIVDRTVSEIVDEFGEVPPLDQLVRARLLGMLICSVVIDDCNWSLLDAVSLSAASLADAIGAKNSRKTCLRLPGRLLEAEPTEE